MLNFAVSLGYFWCFFLPTAALRRYNEINQTLPDRIIVYRDGVGDGQLAAVFEHEVKQFMECFKSVGFQVHSEKAHITF